MSYRINQDCKIAFTHEIYYRLFDLNDLTDKSYSGGLKYVSVRAVGLDSDWVQVQRMDGTKVFVPASVVRYVEHESLVP
jgi:hypothetical protein